MCLQGNSPSCPQGLHTHLVSAEEIFPGVSLRDGDVWLLFIVLGLQEGTKDKFVIPWSNQLQLQQICTGVILMGDEENGNKSSLCSIHSLAKSYFQKQVLNENELILPGISTFCSDTPIKAPGQGQQPKRRNIPPFLYPRLGFSQKYWKIIPLDLFGKKKFSWDGGRCPCPQGVGLDGISSPPNPKHSRILYLGFSFWVWSPFIRILSDPGRTTHGFQP